MTEQYNNNDLPSRPQDEEMEIDLMELAGKLWKNRKYILKMMGIGAVIGIVIAFSIPKNYSVSVTLSPEAGKSASGGLASMASMFGLGSSNLGSDVDALNISLFPEIVSSTPFVLELFDVPVQTFDGAVDTTLVGYLDEQKAPWWGMIMSLPGKVIGGVVSLFNDKEDDGDGKINPFRLTMEQSNCAEALRRSINADVDKKTGVTTVTVTLQDPLVTATVADTVVAKLQQYITAYRVSKAQQDCDYLEQLNKERKKEYYDAQQNLAAYLDANKGVILQSALTERERLQNEMSLAYQVYSQVATQLQVARAKVQEAKPVFAVVEPATVPLKPAGTSKKMILIGFVFLAFVGASAWVLFGKDILKSLRKEISSNK